VWLWRHSSPCGGLNAIAERDRPLTMHISAILQILVLLTLANGAPVVAKKMLGDRCNGPLDFGVMFVDGRPLFGRSKTIRGIVVAILAATAGAPLVGLDLATGAIVAAAAMTGDLLSSFVKRRLDFKPSSQALGLDQIPESLLPMLAARAALSLTALDIAAGVAIFLVGELLLSRFLFQVHLRDEPY
jgi:CDP-2,3-bis-(O-geranylgeranyl)-sn-glycerol synthase